jgi:hypothetical protein
MSRESESEQTQRTVAELLAQYGASAGDAAPRRRRRRAEDPTDTAPQAIIERINSDSGEIPVVNPEVEPPSTRAGRRAKQEPVDPERTAYSAPVRPEPPRAEPPPRVESRRPEPPRAEPPRNEPARAEAPPRAEPRRPEPPRADPPRADPPRADPRRPEARRPAVPPIDPAEETRQVPAFVDDFPPSRPGIPKPASTPEPSRPNLPKPDPSRANLVRPVVKSPLAKPPVAKPPMPPVREAMTEQIPRIPGESVPLDAQVTESVPILPPAPPQLPDPLPDVSPEEWFGDDDDEFAEQEHTQAHSGPYVDDDYSDNYVVDDYEADSDEEPAGLADLDDEEDEEAERSPVKEWLVMIGQLAVGVLGGAALWLGFNWLWRSVPAAALVLALGVTVGLVLLVRKIRRADDLQTTLLAVLVGLIVTVSPAAMLLVKS